MTDLLRHDRRPPLRASLAAAIFAAACGSGDADAPPSATPAGAGDEAMALPAVTPGYATGDPEAGVVIQEWADFQCPFCARQYTENHEAIEALLEEVGGRFEYYEIGAPGHPESLDATVAARCAGAQGAYADARRVIYESQASWSGSLEADTILRALVLPFAADTAELDDCLTNQRLTVGRILNRNLRAAIGQGVRSTPTTIVEVGGARTVLAGLTPAEVIRAAVDSLRGVADPAAAGVPDAPDGAAPPPGS